MSSMVILLSNLLGKSYSPIVAIGNKGLEKGIIMRLVTSESGKPILDGISLTGYGGTRREWDYLKRVIPTVGVGIEKKLDIKNSPIDLGINLLVTQPVLDFLNKDRVNITGGISIKF